MTSFDNHKAAPPFRVRCERVAALTTLPFRDIRSVSENARGTCFIRIVIPGERRLCASRGTWTGRAKCRDAFLRKAATQQSRVWPTFLLRKINPPGRPPTDSGTKHPALTRSQSHSSSPAGSASLRARPKPSDPRPGLSS